MSFDNLILTIIYIVPGFLLMEIRRSIYRAKRMSDFRHFMMSLTYGIIIFVCVRLFDEHVLGVKTDLLNVSSIDVIHLLKLVGCSLVLAICINVFDRGRFTLGRHSKFFKWASQKPQSSWLKVNETPQWCVVYVDDGSIYSGYISFYRSDPDTEFQDFILSSANRVDEDLNVQYEVDGSGVYFNTRDIKRIEYVKGTEE